MEIRANHFSELTSESLDHAHDAYRVIRGKLLLSVMLLAQSTRSFKHHSNKLCIYTLLIRSRDSSKGGQATESTVALVRRMHICYVKFG